MVDIPVFAGIYPLIWTSLDLLKGARKLAHSQKIPQTLGQPIGHKSATPSSSASTENVYSYTIIINFD
jgi:hypothetical protein